MISGNELLPLSEVVANGVPKIVWTCVRRRLKSRIPETLSKPGVPQRFRYLHIETIDGFLGNARRRDNRVPGGHDEILQSELLKRRQVGRHRKSLRAGDAKRAE